MNDNCLNCPYSESGNLHSAPKQRAYSPLEKEDNDSEVLLIFQSPGKVEWEKGRPLQNVANGAGRRLENSFQRIGKNRKDFDITNSVQCYQGKGSNDRDKKPVKKSLEQCRENLKADIESKNYQKIIAFGVIAKEQIEALGYNFDKDHRFIHLKHPSGGLTNHDLDASLNAHNKSLERNSLP